MRAEEGDVVGQLGGDSTEPPLALDIERVARLDLDLGDPGPQRLSSPCARAGTQLLVGGSPRGVDRRLDSTGGVRGACHPRRKLLGPVAREHQVGVAVDEPGDHAAACRIDAIVRGCAGAFDRVDPLVLEDERAIANDSERSSPRASSFVTRRPMLSIASVLMQRCS